MKTKKAFRLQNMFQDYLNNCLSEGSCSVTDKGNGEMIVIVDNRGYQQTKFLHRITEDSYDNGKAIRLIKLTVAMLAVKAAIGIDKLPSSMGNVLTVYMGSLQANEAVDYLGKSDLNEMLWELSQSYPSVGEPIYSVVAA